MSIHSLIVPLFIWNELYLYLSSQTKVAQGRIGELKGKDGLAITLMAFFRRFLGSKIVSQGFLWALFWVVSQLTKGG